MTVATHRRLHARPDPDEETPAEPLAWPALSSARAFPRSRRKRAVSLVVRTEGEIGSRRTDGRPRRIVAR